MISVVLLLLSARYVYTYINFVCSTVYAVAINRTHKARLLGAGLRRRAILSLLLLAPLFVHNTPILLSYSVSRFNTVFLYKMVFDRVSITPVKNIHVAVWVAKIAQQMLIFLNTRFKNIKLSLKVVVCIIRLWLVTRVLLVSAVRDRSVDQQLHVRLKYRHKCASHDQLFYGAKSTVSIYCC